MILLQVGVSDAIRQVDKANEIAAQSLEAAVAVNHLLIGAIILIGITLTSVIIVLWNKLQKIETLYQQKEKEDNEFKLQYINEQRASTEANRQLSVKVGELVVEIKNSSMDKLSAQLQTFMMQLTKDK